MPETAVFLLLSVFARSLITRLLLYALRQLVDIFYRLALSVFTRACLPFRYYQGTTEYRHLAHARLEQGFGTATLDIVGLQTEQTYR